MGTTTKVAAAAGAMTLLGGLTVLTGTATAASGEASWCRSGATVDIARLPVSFGTGVCSRADLTVRSGAAQVRLPARGQTVTASVLTTSGGAELTVARGRDGFVRINPGAPGGTGTTASACSSNGHTILPYKWTHRYGWTYNPRNMPGSVAGRAGDAIRAATTNITAGHDGCGIPGNPRASHRYNGKTSAAPGITPSAGCGSNDGRNVTGWKSLTASGVLAVTCTYYSGSQAVASDAAINTRFRWSLSPSSCSGAYDLKGVMTHERGHTFGLGHTTADQALTMYPSVRSCDFSKSSLGKGDLTGLFAIYGKA